MNNPLNLNFNNRIINELPSSYRNILATPLQNMHLVAFSTRAARLLDLSANSEGSKEFIEIFGGQLIPHGGHHIAQVYAGHQFGHFVPQLGDGRSIFLGEVQNKCGNFYDIHLKGAGQTPYSRMGDGRAVLRSCIREFLASEAMAALNIPTTRALAIVGSDEPVYREQVETGAIMTRLAPSHLRFGNFEYYFYKNKLEELTALTDFCIKHYFPDALASEHPYASFFDAVVTQTALLIAKWQAVGFAHGVMNTDNMSILGLTLDYGPFGFLDEYQPGFICNHSDHSGRYAFDQQPSIGLWNLSALAHTLTPLLSETQIAHSLSLYEPCLVQHYLELMGQKLGLTCWLNDEDEFDDRVLLSSLLAAMAANNADYTLTFRYLNQINQTDDDNEHCHPFIALFSKEPALILAWLTRYRARLRHQGGSDQERYHQQNSVNPIMVLRNYLAEQAIVKAQQGDYDEINRLLTLLESPYVEQANCQAYYQTAPHWGKDLEISCSS